jgi:OPA family glycerol-3-phosphate transporter-like MFS transporter
VLSIALITALHKKSFFNNEIRGAAALFLFAALLALPLSLLIDVDATVTRFICLILAALICAAMHAINFLLISCLPGRFARFGRSSTIGGLVNAFVYVGAASATYGFALISEHAGWSATIVSWIAVGIVGVLLALLGLRKYSAFIKIEK